MMNKNKSFLNDSNQVNNLTNLKQSVGNSTAQTIDLEDGEQDGHVNLRLIKSELNQNLEFGQQINERIQEIIKNFQDLQTRFYSVVPSFKEFGQPERQFVDQFLSQLRKNIAELKDLKSKLNRKQQKLTVILNQTKPDHRIEQTIINAVDLQREINNLILTYDNQLEMIQNSKQHMKEVLDGEQDEFQQMRDQYVRQELNEFTKSTQIDIYKFNLFLKDYTINSMSDLDYNLKFFQDKEKEVGGDVDYMKEIVHFFIDQLLEANQVIEFMKANLDELALDFETIKDEKQRKYQNPKEMEAFVNVFFITSSQIAAIKQKNQYYLHSSYCKTFSQLKHNYCQHIDRRVKNLERECHQYQQIYEFLPNIAEYENNLIKELMRYSQTREEVRRLLDIQAQENSLVEEVTEIPFIKESVAQINTYRGLLKDKLALLNQWHQYPLYQCIDIFIGNLAEKIKKEHNQLSNSVIRIGEMNRKQDSYILKVFKQNIKHINSQVFDQKYNMIKLLFKKQSIFCQIIQYHEIFYQLMSEQKKIDDQLVQLEFLVQDNDSLQKCLYYSEILKIFDYTQNQIEIYLKTIKILQKFFFIMNTQFNNDYLKFQVVIHQLFNGTQHKNQAFLKSYPIYLNVQEIQDLEYYEMFKLSIMIPQSLYFVCPELFHDKEDLNMDLYLYLTSPPAVCNANELMGDIQQEINEYLSDIINRDLISWMINVTIKNSGSPMYIIPQIKLTHHEQSAIPNSDQTPTPTPSPTPQLGIRSNTEIAITETAFPVEEFIGVNRKVKDNNDIVNFTEKRNPKTKDLNYQFKINENHIYKDYELELIITIKQETALVLLQNQHLLQVQVIKEITKDKQSTLSYPCQIKHISNSIFKFNSPQIYYFFLLLPKMNNKLRFNGMYARQTEGILLNQKISTNSFIDKQLRLRIEYDILKNEIQIKQIHIQSIINHHNHDHYRHFNYIQHMLQQVNREKIIWRCFQSIIIAFLVIFQSSNQEIGRQMLKIFFNQIQQKTQLSQLRDRYDYIIVGAGSAGCVLANRLSQKPQTRVLLIEAGGADTWHWIRIPIGYLQTIGDARTDWCFNTTVDPGLNNRSILYARGKVVGGCSSINGMISMRGQQNDYDFWQKWTGCSDWGWESALKTFKKLETYVPFDAEQNDGDFHGTSGPVNVEDIRVKWDILDDWRMAAAQAGLPKLREFNRGNNYGCAYFQVNQVKGVRQSMADAYLHPILERSNLDLMLHSQVKEILFDEENKGENSKLKAAGIRFENQGKLIDIQVNQELILSAGAVASPQILQLSGIGPRVLLDKLGIPVRIQNDNVGSQLQDHLQIRPVYRIYGAQTVNSKYHNIFKRIGMGLQYAFNQTGPLAMSPSTMGGFGYSSEQIKEAGEMPNIEWHVQALSLQKFGDPLEKFSAITPSVCNLRPTSRGHVMITSADFQKQPEIKLNYLSTQEDQRVAIDSLKFTRFIMQQDFLQKYTPEEVRPGAIAETDQQLLEAAQNLSTTIFHPIGTCQMGKQDDQLSVVDSKLRLKGATNIRIVDASIMPCITSGNTNTPTVMIAEKASDYIKEASQEN